ncbi:hypothetical protein DES53_108111 [Roseimicrobium gellanilyticum]|uniref:Uncharacterized protein n=1 Tax=Roseimicrobium gellanilyticum TaxID=748857 RepID=A0A366HFC3_9BACT|nr:hypothetical protein [Roseimicrobium gellanilyticum]RBP40404.1 hypothetical protein DES53_108111 [Roseimicrobium gellanilyticum]
MRFSPVCLLALLMSISFTLCRAEEQPAGKKAAELIANSAFCIAYVFRDADERDRRPGPAGDPFQSAGESILEGSILSEGEGIMDVAALASRVTSQARVSKAQISRLTAAVQRTDSLFPFADCYSPHHAFVFYSAQGEPQCCIEICFTCKRFKTSPQLRVMTVEEELRAVVGIDLIEIANIFDELKLPLTPYKSFEELEKRLAKLAEETKARIAEEEKAEAAEKAKQKK